MTKRIVIAYFPKAFKYASPLIFGGAVWLLVLHFLFWPFVLLLFIIIVFTTNYITEIDLQEKRYYDYLFFLGVRLSQESGRFTHLDRIIVTKDSYTQMINTRVQSRQLKLTEYTCTLLFDHNKSLDLLTRYDKTELLMGIRDFARFLEVDIEDRTSSRHYWIDLNKITD